MRGDYERRRVAIRLGVALRLILVLFIALALSACGGSQRAPVADRPQPDPPTGMAGLDLGVPSELCKAASLASYTKQPGGAYQLDPPFSHNQVARAGDYALYTPDWSATGETDLDGLAWAMYVYNLLGMTGAQPLHLTFAEPLPAGVQCWIELGNQTRETWDWLLYPTGEDPVIPDLAPYTATGDRLVLAIIFTGTGSATLC